MKQAARDTQPPEILRSIQSWANLPSMTPISRDSYARFLNQYNTLAKERHLSQSIQENESEVNKSDKKADLDPLTEELVNLQEPNYDSVSFYNQSLSAFSTHNFRN